MIANAPGKALTNALFNLQERGRMFIGHGTEVYEGMIVGCTRAATIWWSMCSRASS
jgi:predicted membrane GTPase involved in stress response